MEPGLICYECVGTHPGCGLTDFDSRWYWGKICPRSDDRCVKVGKSEWKSNHLEDTSKGSLLHFGFMPYLYYLYFKRMVEQD